MQACAVRPRFPSPFHALNTLTIGSVVKNIICVLESQRQAVILTVAGRCGMRSLIYTLGLLLLAVFSVAGQEAGDLLPHAPIQITGDELFTEENGVVRGSGTQGDPYVIRNFVINAQEMGYGIEIVGTMSAFRIENCRIVGATAAGIKLVEVDTAIVHRCWIEGCYCGVFIEESLGVVISENTFLDNELRSLSLLESSQCHLFNSTIVSGQCGIWLGGKTSKNLIHDNVFDNCGAAGMWISNLCDWNHIYYNDFIDCRAISDSINRWDDEKGIGNYWSRYSGEDKDQDGIGDEPFSIYGSTYEYDYHPALQPFHWEEAD